MANNNVIDILGRLERQKQEQEARLESLQLKARTLKRRREELGKSLADISQQSDAREAGLSAARSRVESLQLQFSQHQARVNISLTMFLIHQHFIIDIQKMTSCIDVFELEIAKKISFNDRFQTFNLISV